MNRRFVCGVVVLGVTAIAHAQSLFQAPIPPQLLTPAGPGGQPGAVPTPAGTQAPAPAAQEAPTLEQVSLMVVKPSKPKSYQKHDKVEVIINENSLAKHQQKLDDKTQTNFKLQVKQFPSMSALFTNGILIDGINAEGPSAETAGNRTYKGDGTYERTDRLTARLSAIVLDVKPNGQLVLEARESIQSDEETKTMVLSGVCDPKDISNANTVQSTQLANLTIRVQHTGQVKDAATKGFVTRLFETLFNF